MFLQQLLIYGIRFLDRLLCFSFRISRAAADFVFGYMGARGISAGERLAKIFDSNGNGWVALYKRGVYRYKGAPLIGYQHRTF